MKAIYTKSLLHFLEVLVRIFPRVCTPPRTSQRISFLLFQALQHLPLHLCGDGRVAYVSSGLFPIKIKS